MINFITNQPRELRSGGFSAMNAAAYDALLKLDAIHYAGPIDPPIVIRQKVASKLLRSTGFQGDFFTFSQERLEAIAEEVRCRCNANAQLDFFHGFTPWILTRPPRPYVSWSDCTFTDYIGTYHHREKFRPADLERIEHAEAVWLRAACAVGFSSDWAARRAVKDYGLDASRVHVVGNFGEVEIPADDEYGGAKQFAFVSTNFQAKGGPAVLSAFQRVRQRHSDATLIVVGAKPRAISDSAVTATGFLRKEVPEEADRFRKILSSSRALVHPTGSDVSPLIVIEAGMFGCPAIASNRFAIPELIDSGVTGILLDDPSAGTVADAMNWMLENELAYQDMRRRARIKAVTQYSKAAFAAKIRDLVAPLLQPA